MSTLILKIKNLLNRNVLVIPTVYVVTLAVMFYLSLTNGIAKINNQRKSIASKEKAVNTLNEKVNTLRQFSSKYNSVYDSTLLALPGKSSLLFAYAQVKSLIANSEVVVTDMRLGGLTASGDQGQSLASSSLDFTVAGELDGILEFFRKIHLTAPIMYVKKVEILTEADLVTAEVSIESYWSRLPGEIPSVSTPIQTISNEEQAALSDTVGLNKPVLEDVTSNVNYNRSNPF